MIYLTPCPFCGSRKVKLSAYRKLIHIEEVQVTYGVGCYNCGINTCTFTSVYDLDEDKKLVCVKDGRQQAIDAWNRRANDENA